MKKKIEIYCDGSYNKEKNTCQWATIKVHGDEITELSNYLPVSGKADVERAESEAIFMACRIAQIEIDNSNTGNFVIYTDAQFVIDKILGHVPNATGHPNIKGIQNILKGIKESPLPVSLEIKHLPRCSNEYMKKVHELI